MRFDVEDMVEEALLASQEWQTEDAGRRGGADDMFRRVMDEKLRERGFTELSFTRSFTRWFTSFSRSGLQIGNSRCVMGCFSAGVARRPSGESIFSEKSSSSGELVRTLIIRQLGTRR
jgi:hypothetical protein